MPLASSPYSEGDRAEALPPSWRGEVSVRDLAARLDVEPGYISVYRARLLDAGMISTAGHGRVRLEMPYLRDYLREHAASLAGASLRLGPAG